VCFKKTQEGFVRSELKETTLIKDLLRVWHGSICHPLIDTFLLHRSKFFEQGAAIFGSGALEEISRYGAQR